jgi:FtsH-binding integral membrane protein
LGNVINVAMFLNPSLVPVALLSTAFVFVCFTMATFFSNTRQMLFMAGSLMSALSVLMIFSLINIFIRSETLSHVTLLLGLAVTCGFICFDTAAIIEKKRMGDNDHIAHAMWLFIDFIDLFRHILIILMNKEANSRSEKRDGDRERKRR